MSNPSDSTSIACGECGNSNPASYRFCENCGRQLESETPPVAVVPEFPGPASITVHEPLHARIRLRFVLLVSGVVLVVLAIFAAAFAGVQWGIAPLVVGGISLVVALGRMSSESLSLFRSDVRTLLIGPSPATAVGAAAISPGEQGAERDRISVSVDRTEPNVDLGFRGAEAVNETQPTVATGEQVPFAVRSEKQIGTIVFAAGLLAAAFSLYMFPKGPPNTVAWWSFGLSIVLMLGAMPAFEGGWTALAARFRSGYRISFEPRAAIPWFVLGGILLFGLLIRLYNLDSFPPGLWFDEADNLDKARQIAEDPGYLPVFVPFTELPSLFLLPIAVVVKFAGIAITTGRLVAVAFGLAGIVAIFLMVRQMSGMAMGLIAAFLTAVMRWDLIWSRTGMHGITAPFFAALTAWLTYRAVQKGGRTDFAVAGAALGLGMWYYAAYRLFPLVIGLVLIHALIAAKNRRRLLLQNIGIMAFFAVMVTLPLFQFAASHPDEFFRRTSVTSVFAQAPEGETVQVIQESLTRHLAMFHLEGDPNGRHNIPGAPMLDMISGLLMLVGLAVAVARWRNAAYFVLPVWMLVMLMPGVLTIPWEAPQSLRTITVIPAVIALVTLGIAAVWKVGSRVNLPAVRVGTAAVIALLLAGIAYSNISAYFGEQANDPAVYAAYSTDDTLIARDMSEQAARGYSPMVSRQFRHSLVASLFGHRYPRQTIAAPSNIPLDPGMVWRGAAIYLEPRESGFYDTLKAYYPSAEFREVRPPMGGDVLYYSAYISREELETAQGLMSRRTMADGDVVQETILSTERFWKVDAEGAETPFDVEWKGTLHVTHPGEYTFELRSGSSSEVLLDGTVILTDSDPNVVIEPAVGLHAIEVRSRVLDSDGVLRLLWRQPPVPDDSEGTSANEKAQERQLEPISAGNLYHGDIRSLGLSGRFFGGIVDEADVGGRSPDAMRITPGIGGAFWYNPVVEGEHLAVWDGYLSVPEEGLHKFRLGHVHGEMRVVIDGDTLIDSRTSVETDVELSAGRHRVRMEYVTSAGSPWFEVLWTPPGQSESRIAPEYLAPATEYMFRVVE